MIEIWGRKNSSNVMPVVWAVAELGLEYVRHNVGGSFGGVDTPEYKAMNPNSRVPTINDNGLIMWESNAIVRYLSATYGQGSLWPDDSHQRAIADQWMEWSKTTFYPSFFPAFWQQIRVVPEERDQGAIDRAVKATADVLTIVDAHLQNHDYMAGDTLTMGDLSLGANAYRYFNLPIERKSFPHFEAWYERLCQRPAYQQHIMIPFGSSFAEWLELEKAGA